MQNTKLCNVESFNLYITFKTKYMYIQSHCNSIQYFLSQLSRLDIVIGNCKRYQRMHGDVILMQKYNWYSCELPIAMSGPDN